MHSGLPYARHNELLLRIITTFRYQSTVAIYKWLSSTSSNQKAPHPHPEPMIKNDREALITRSRRSQSSGPSSASQCKKGSRERRQTILAGSAGQPLIPPGVSAHPVCFGPQAEGLRQDDGEGLRARSHLDGQSGPGRLHPGHPPASDDAPGAAQRHPDARGAVRRQSAAGQARGRLLRVHEPGESSLFSAPDPPRALPYPLPSR